MAKFNIGDKVVIRKHKLPPYLYDMIGKVFTIKDVNEFMGLNPCYHFEETRTGLVGDTWIWSEDSLKKVSPFDVAKVIYDNPTTTVYWLDGTYTVVRCHEGDEFSEEVGLAMAIVRKAHGNTSKYIDTFKKFVVDK